MDGGVVHPEVALPLAGDDVGALTIAAASTRIVGIVGVVRVIDIDFAGCQREQSSNEQEECEEGRKESFHDFPVLSDRSVAFVVIVTIIALLSRRLFEGKCRGKMGYCKQKGDKKTKTPRKFHVFEEFLVFLVSILTT